MVVSVTTVIGLFSRHYGTQRQVFLLLISVKDGSVRCRHSMPVRRITPKPEQTGTTETVLWMLILGVLLVRAEQRKVSGQQEPVRKVEHMLI